MYRTRLELKKQNTYVTKWKPDKYLGIVGSSSVNDVISFHFILCELYSRWKYIIIWNISVFFFKYILRRKLRKPTTGCKNKQSPCDGFYTSLQQLYDFKKDSPDLTYNNANILNNLLLILENIAKKIL